jgi:hypothetical protein
MVLDFVGTFDFKKVITVTAAGNNTVGFWLRTGEATTGSTTFFDSLGFRVGEIIDIQIMNAQNNTAVRGRVFLVYRGKRGGISVFMDGALQDGIGKPVMLKNPRRLKVMGDERVFGLFNAAVIGDELELDIVINRWKEVK